MKLLLACISVLVALSTAVNAQCVSTVAAPVSCAVPAGATPVTATSNVTISGGTFSYSGTGGISNLNLSGGTLYYSSNATLNGVNMSGGTLIYSGSGSIVNFNQSGGNVQVCSGSLAVTGNLNGGSLLVTQNGATTFSNGYSLQNSYLFTNYGTTTFQNGLTVAGTSGMLVNAVSGRLTARGQVFFNGPGFVNLGTANLETLVVNSNGAACLGPNSSLNVTTFQTNDRAGSFTVSPANANLACTRITNYGNFNRALYTQVPSRLGVCKAGAVAPAEQVQYGTAQVTPNCSGCRTVLPVQLVSFVARLSSSPGGPVALRWRTASEVNHRGFVVERSADGRVFSASSALVPGTGGQQLGGTYSWTDTDPLPGASYYRLRIVAVDGTAEYSPVVAVQASSTNEWAWAYPADADHLRLSWLVSPAPAADLTWQLLDVQGRLVRQQRIAASTGTTTLELASLSTGAYWIRVQQGEQRQLLRFGRP